MGILVQDGATAHTAKATMQVINQDFKSVLTDQPGNSHDFSIIEHMLAKLHDSVFRQARPGNRNQLIVRVQKEWVDIDQNCTPDLVENFSLCIFSCKDNNCGHEKH